MRGCDRDRVIEIQARLSLIRSHLACLARVYPSERATSAADGFEDIERTQLRIGRIERIASDMSEGLGLDERAACEYVARAA